MNRMNFDIAIQHTWETDGPGLRFEAESRSSMSVPRVRGDRLQAGISVEKYENYVQWAALVRGRASVICHNSQFT